jgi:glycosyltransferase involved in cell wall biosynthesis
MMTGPLAHRVIACCGGMVVPGGAERMMFEVIAALTKAGIPVHCILNGWAHDQIVPLVGQSGATWSASAYFVRFDRHTRRPAALGSQLWDVVRTSWDLIRTAITFRPTHVMVPDHETVLRNYPTLLVLRLFGVRVLMKLCNAPAAGTFYRRLWRRVIDPAVTTFICNSKFTRTELLAHGIARTKTSLIYEIPPRRARTRTAAPRNGHKLIFIGQIIPEKGLHVLLEAVALLAHRGREVTLDVIGDLGGWISPAFGDYRERLTARAAEADLVSRVHFLGWREDVPELLSESAVHCCPSLPSIRESFGLVVVEAKSAGTPSVVFQSGALTELVTHQVDGFVCPAPTARDLADGIEFFLDNPTRLAMAGSAARHSARRYDVGGFARAWQNAITSDGEVTPVHAAAAGARP